jgi:hypothetical protein
LGYSTELSIGEEKAVTVRLRSRFGKGEGKKAEMVVGKMGGESLSPPVRRERVTVFVYLGVEKNQGGRKKGPPSSDQGRRNQFSSLTHYFMTIPKCGFNIGADFNCCNSICTIPPPPPPPIPIPIPPPLPRNADDIRANISSGSSTVSGGGEVEERLVKGGDLGSLFRDELVLSVSELARL